MPKIIVNSLEEVSIDGKPSGTIFDVLLAGADKDDLAAATYLWRDKFLTDKAAEIQQVHFDYQGQIASVNDQLAAVNDQKSQTEAELAAATSQVADLNGILQNVAIAESLDEVKSALPADQESLKQQKIEALRSELASLESTTE